MSAFLLTHPQFKKILISDAIFIIFLGLSVFFIGFEVLTAVVIKCVSFWICLRVVRI
jgi:hypothetical protein